MLTIERVQERTANSIVPPSSRTATVQLSQVVAALSKALDLTHGQPQGHAMRTCIIGMRLAQQLGLAASERSALFYALLLKDLGCSSNAAKISHLFGSDDRATKRAFRTVDSNSIWETIGYLARNVTPDGSIFKRAAQIARIALAGAKEAKSLVEVRCERGATIARMLQLPALTAEAIRALDEHWDGQGHPLGLKGDQIPILSRIMCLAQTLEVFVARDGVDAALDMACKRSGRWFDPQLVLAACMLRHDDDLWASLASGVSTQRLAQLEPQDHAMVADDAMLDRLSWAFAQVVDAKSPWTQKHSEGVAQIAVGIGQAMGFSLEDLSLLKRAGLLHDIGKLGVSNTILDKPGKLTGEERAAMQQHPAFSQSILSHVPCFADVAELAGSHHERLDHKGYYRNLGADELSPMARVMVVADMFEALTAERPYRANLSREEVLAILEKDAGTGICPQALDALKASLKVNDYTPRRLRDVTECSTCVVA